MISPGCASVQRGRCGVRSTLSIGYIEIEAQDNLYNTRNPKVTPRYNTNFLQDPPTVRAFQIALSNRYQVLVDLVDEDQQQSIEEVWREQKQVWLDTSKATLGPQQTQHKEWISTET